MTIAFIRQKDYKNCKILWRKKSMSYNILFGLKQFGTRYAWT